MSYYKPDLLEGNHEFRPGSTALLHSFNNRCLADHSGGYQLRSNNGVPFQLNTRNTPAKPG